MSDLVKGTAGGGQLTPLRIGRAYDAAEGIRAFELMSVDGGELPSFTPGAHVKVCVPNGALRKYSLCNDPADRSHYLIAVKRDAQGQGGSMSLVDHAKVGDTLLIGAPENAFPLVQDAKLSLFIAGGIGITPILSMIRSFGEVPPQPWKLFYFTRNPQSTAFLQELSVSPLHLQMNIHHDDGDPAKAFDLWSVLEKANTAHIYCCGPKSLMDSVRDMTGHWSPANVHFESFYEGGGVNAGDQPFTLTLKKSAQTFEVPVGKTILTVLREHGFALASSCERGTCGTSTPSLISGEADHRDYVLMPEEEASQIMICVSRAKSTELVLDL